MALAIECMHWPLGSCITSYTMTTYCQRVAPPHRVGVSVAVAGRVLEALGHVYRVRQVARLESVGAGLACTRVLRVRVCWMW